MAQEDRVTTSTADARPGLRDRVAPGAIMALSGAAVWVALWGDLTTGTVVAGLCVGGLVGTVFSRVGPRATAGRPVVRPLALLRLVTVFSWMLVVSTWTVTARVCARRVRVAPAVVAVRLPPSSEAVATLVANAVTLTPGTLTLDAVRDADGTVRMVVHALDAPDTATVRTDVLTLHRLVAEAFPRPRAAVRTGGRP